MGHPCSVYLQRCGYALRGVAIYLQALRGVAIYLQALRGVAEDLGTKVDVAMAMLTIMEVKQLKEDERCVMKSQLEVCLVRQSGVKQLWQHVEDLRAVKYSQEDHTHEDLLMKVCPSHKMSDFSLC